MFFQFLQKLLCRHSSLVPRSHIKAFVRRPRCCFPRICPLIESRSRTIDISFLFLSHHDANNWHIWSKKTLVQKFSCSTCDAVLNEIALPWWLKNWSLGTGSIKTLSNMMPLRRSGGQSIEIQLHLNGNPPVDSCVFLTASSCLRSLVPIIRC